MINGFQLLQDVRITLSSTCAKISMKRSCFDVKMIVHNLRCIERIYGDHGLDIMDLLKKDAPFALPILLTRLKQKHEECTRWRNDLNKVWAEIYLKNYDKSLDHRSFYFKQQDSKNLSKKALLNEIKEISDMKRKEDDFLLAAVSGRNITHVPHMEFEYSDIGIHEDIYQLVKYSCHEICTDDDLEKVMKIWTNFIEPMFEVPSRLQQTDVNEKILKSENQKDGNCVIGENHSIPDDAVAITVKSNHSRNSDGSSLHEQSTSSCQVGLAKAYNGVKDVTSSDVNHTAQKKSDVFCSNPLHATSLSRNATSLSGPIKLAISIQQLDDSRLLPIPRADQSFREENVDNASGVCGAMNIFKNPTSLKGIKAKHCDKISPSSDVTDCKGLPNSLIMVQQAKSQSPENLKPEKEEGEISPNHDSEEDNFTSYGNTSEEGAHGPKGSACYRKVLEETCRSRGWGIDADADEDGEFTVHKSSDSEIDDASASQSSDGKVYSQENQGEHRDHNEDEKKAEKECEAEKIGTFSECMLQNAKPLNEHVSLASCGKNGDSHIFYGSDSFYVLFRLHQLLYSRIKSAKINSSTGEHKWRGSTDTSPTDLYARFMSAVYHLLDGSFDNTKFEDACRAILGTQSYVLFTLDKLIFKIVKQLKIIAAKEKDNILLQLYAYERSRKPGNFVDLVYWKNACVLLDDESVFRIECSNTPTQMFIELVDNRHSKTEKKGMPMDTSFAAYLENELLSLVPKRSDESNVFLRRNKRRNESCNELSMKGVQMVNGLEYKISCSSPNMSYILGTEDVLFRWGMKRRKL